MLRALVNPAMRDPHIASKGAADRLGQRLRAIDDERASHGWIESTLDEIVDERLHRRRGVGRALDEAERVFVAVRVDANRRDEEHIFIHVNAADLDRQQIEVVKPIHAFMRAADNARKRREVADFDSPASVGRRNASLGQSDRTLEKPRRDVEVAAEPRPELISRD